MASNTLGQLFKITTWGESHGKAMGVVIDGCPAGIALSEADINLELERRAPGKNRFTTPRQESDHCEIYSGLYEGQTTGAPISIIIPNRDVRSVHYEPIKQLLRPGHANFTYLQKYGIYDYRGGGRASARETVCRVAAGAVAKKIIALVGVEVCAYLSSVADVQMQISENDFEALKNATRESAIFCPDLGAAEAMMQRLDAAVAAGDSLGGVVSFVATGLPAGWGDPVYEKLEANLAKAMLSLPATKGFEIGEGFLAAGMAGSVHNDLFVNAREYLHPQGREASATPEEIPTMTRSPASPLSTISTATNHAGGTLGGISTGMPLTGRVAFKPPSSIKKSQATLDLQGQSACLQLPEGSRHDPCVAIRAVPIVEAMCALVLVDALLMSRTAKWSTNI